MNVIGRLTRDPELSTPTIGGEQKTIAKFTVAVGKKFGAEGADFFNVEIWGKQAEAVGRYLNKGRLVYAKGRPAIDTYTNKEGQQVNAFKLKADEVVFLDKSAEGTTSQGQTQTRQAPPQQRQATQYPNSGTPQQGYQNNGYPQQQQQQQQAGYQYAGQISEDDLPF